jgi:hypothetical protein
MRKLRVCIIDLINNNQAHAWYVQLMYANYRSIMPQIIGVWCQQEGHDVTYLWYGGHQNLLKELPDNADLVFISSFTFTAQYAYALSNVLRSRGAVTVLGGPHARCFPEDACKYFDYVLGLTDKTLIREILNDRTGHRPEGITLSAEKQPTELPGVRERWEFIEPAFRKASVIKAIPMISSFGCPFQCDFCVDSFIPYQPLDLQIIKDDLRFLIGKMKRPLVAWHDPNFGVRFNEIMNAIEEAVPPGSIKFIAECNLSLLSEPNVRRLVRNEFKFIMAGVESWFEYGMKSRTGAKTGMDKVRLVAEQVKMICKHVPLFHTNFMLGADMDEGPEPFELTKAFLEMVPGTYPAYAILTAYGRGSQRYEDYLSENRILPIPFHFLRTIHSSNVKPNHYSWIDFHDHVIALFKYSFSRQAMYQRFKAIKTTLPKWLSLGLSLSVGGVGKLRHYMEVRRLLGTDRRFRDFYERETTAIPQYFINRIRGDLGSLWPWLPDGASEYDPYSVGKRKAETRMTY